MKGPKVILRYYINEYEPEYEPEGKDLKTTLTSKKCSRWLREFAMDCSLDHGTHMVMAWQGGQVVGFWCVQWAAFLNYYSLGTYVESRLRRQGIGSRMWEFLNKRLGGRLRLRASAVTPSGRGFLYRMEKTHKVQFSVDIEL